MARKDIVKFVCDHCGAIFEDSMSCEEPEHGYPNMWSGIIVSEADYKQHTDSQRWYDLCQNCSSEWNLKIRAFFEKAEVD